MEKSKVFFTDLRTVPGNDLLTKLERLIRRAGIADIDFEGKFTAIKIHFGEPGNMAYIRPNYAARVVDVIRSLGGKPFLTDSNTLYSGGRSNAVDHLNAAMENGFTSIKGIRVSKERFSTKRADHIHYTGSIIRTDICEVARFSEMNLDGSELSVKINISDTSSSDELFEFGEKVVSRNCPEIGEEYFRFFHSYVYTIGCPLNKTLKSPCPRRTMPIITTIAPVILLIHSIVFILNDLRKRLKSQDIVNQ